MVFVRWNFIMAVIILLLKTIGNLGRHSNIQFQDLACVESSPRYLSHTRDRRARPFWVARRSLVSGASHKRRTVASVRRS